MDNQIEKLVSQTKEEKDPFIKSKLMRSLIRDHNLRVNQLANKLSIKSSYLCHFLRLRRLPEIVIDGYYSNQISLSHLFIISRLKDQSKTIEVYEKILTKNLTVLQTEETVREILHGIKTEGEVLTHEEKENYLKNFDQELKLKITQTRIKSRLEIEVKGSLAKTTKLLRSVLDRLTGSSPLPPYPEDSNGKKPDQ